MPRKRKTTRTVRKKPVRRSSPRKRAARAPSLQESTRRQISGIVQICAAIFLLLVFKEQAGVIGTSIYAALAFLFGTWTMLFPIILFISGTFYLTAQDSGIELKRTTGVVIALFAFLGLAHLGAPLEKMGTEFQAYAGAIGFLMSFPFVLVASQLVGYTVLGALFLVGVFIAFEPDIGGMVQFVKDLFAPNTVRTRLNTTLDAKTARAIQNTEKKLEEVSEKIDLIEEDKPAPELNIVRPAFALKELHPSQKGDKDSEDSKKPKQMSTDEIQMKDTRFSEWTFPTFDLLDSAQSQLTVNDDELKAQAKIIEQKLQEFGIDVTMRDAHPGPSVTQFTLQPSEGVKLSKIGNLKDDLALALSAQSLRIEAPIPGKGLVGIEMPNRERTTVHLREILESQEFTQSLSSLALPLGRDVSGAAVVASLEDMPHLLIAGATGSGKSVCMNTFLTALLFQNAPHELKFILIDPKRVELIPYDNIPHLLTPVITESEKALQALRWAVAEMGRRLHRFSEVGARNLDEYNEKQSNDEGLMPRIVIVIDELADLMMRQYRKDTEVMIARIAQMARACGMHLIIATQRPSVDVITGIIKANIPTRIAFRTVSQIDSRTILDSVGSEDLLGKGDMLFMNASTQNPVRVQGIYVNTKEVERVINAVKIAGGGEITEQIEMQDSDEDDLSGSYIDLDADDDGGDTMFFDAVRVVQEFNKASASLLQRQLKVGYARAARLLDIMQEKGLIGPVDGAKARKVFTDKFRSE